MATTTTQQTLLDQDLIPPAAGFRELLGSSPAPTTIWRYIRRGLRGQKLAVVKVAGRSYTSRQEIRRWIGAVEADRTAEQGDDADERPEHIERRLAESGLL